MILAIGFRVRSKRGTQFRIWATSVLREYIIKGFALDDNRLKKGGNPFGEDYFRELLDRIRSIRASERRIWQQITDIFAECSIDYDRNSPFTRDFYAMVQNKFHYAIVGQTGAEIVYSRADHTKENMGLTSWKKSPNGKIMESDVVIAKNYLSKDELQDLEGIVSAFLEIAENRARRHIPMTMEDWAEVLQRYMDLNNRPLLSDAGHVTHEQAEEKALTEYEKFRVIQDKEIMSDFDRQIKMLFNGSDEK